MKTNRILAGSIALLATTSALRAAIFTWDGGSGVDSNISTAANWSPDGAPVSNLATTDLVFDGIVRLTPNFSAVFSANSLTFNNNAAANAFTFSGSTLTIGAGGIVNNDANTQTFSNAVTIGTATSTFNAAAGALTFNNALSLGSNTLTLSGGSTITINGTTTGTGTITKIGAGLLVLNATPIAIGADLNLNAGTTTIGATGVTQTFSGTSTVTVAAVATLNINENTVFEGGSALNRLNPGAINLAVGKTLTFQGGSDFTTAGFVFTGGNFIATGSGSMIQCSGAGSGVNGGATLSILNGASFVSTSYLDVGSGTNGTLIVDGSGSSFSASGGPYWGSGGGTANVTFSNDAAGAVAGLEIGHFPGGTGNVQVLTGADVTSSNGLYIGANPGGLNAGTATVTVDGSGSTWTHTGPNINIGSATGSAVLNVQNGATFTTGSGTTDVRDTGRINITGGTFIANGSVSINGGAQFTRNSTGSFTMAPGKALTAFLGGDIVFTGSHTTNGAGLQAISPGSTVQITDTLTVNGGSTVYINNGGSLSTGNSLDIDAGTLLVDGVGATVTTGFDFNYWGLTGAVDVTFSNNAIGNLAGVTMGLTPFGATVTRVLSGADVTSSVLRLGAAPGSIASLTIDGAGSTWSIPVARLLVGADSGPASVLAVNNGGTFTAGGDEIFVNAAGRVEINGGSFISNSNFNVIGGQLTRNGTGTFTLGLGKRLALVAGGTATFTESFNQIQRADLFIDGAGSSLTTTGSFLWIGDALAPSHLSVTLGGEIASGSGLQLGVLNAPVVLTVSGTGSRISAAPDSLSRWIGDVDITGGATADLGDLWLAENQNPAPTSASLDVSSGSVVTLRSLRIAADFSFNANTAAITVDGVGSQITLPGASTVAIGSTTGSGTLTIRNGGTFTTGTGSVEINQTGVVNIDGGTLNVLGQITYNGTFNFTAGTLNLLGGNNLTIGTGGLLGQDPTLLSNRTINVANTTTIDASRTLTLDGGTLRTGTLTNNGTIDFQRGTLGITGAGGFNVGSGALGALVSLGTGANLAVNNTLTVASAASLTLNGGTLNTGTLANSGTVRVNTGLATLGAITNQSGGRIFIGDTAVIGNAPVWNNNAGSRLTLENGGVIRGSGVFSEIYNYGLITGDGNIAVGVANYETGEIRAEAGRTLYLSTTGLPSNHGRYNLLGGTLDFDSPVNNEPNGFISGRGTLYTNGLTNHGVMAFSGGNTDIYGDVTNLTGGRIVTSGAGSVTTFYDDVVHNGMEINTGAGASTVFFGSQSGAGSFTGTGSIYYIGDLQPGNSPATISYGGGVFLGATTDLTMEIGGLSRGTQYDGLNIAGSFATDGTLALMLINGYSPVLGDTFNLFDTASTTGAFDSLLLPALAQYLTWDTSDLYTTGTVEVSTTLTPIEQWRLANFGSPANAGNGANLVDFDGDGIRNLAEYGLGLDPRVPTSTGLPFVSIVTVGANKHAAITFSRPLSATDVNYVIEVSSDLATWLPGSSYSSAGDVPANANTTEVSRSAVGGIETITVRANTTVTADARRFLRVRITHPTE